MRYNTVNVVILNDHYTYADQRPKTHYLAAKGNGEKKELQVVNNWLK